MSAADKKPAAIRPGLMIVLLAVLGATVWSFMQGDDDDAAASPKRQRAGHAATASEGRNSGRNAGGAGRPVVRRGADAASAAQAQTLAQWQERLAQAGQRWSERGSFAALSDTGRKAWSANLPPPPPPPPAPPPPPPPMAPAFPYQMVGRWEEPVPAVAAPAAKPASAARAADAPKTMAMAVIVSPQNTWVVKAGEVIEGQWRVDSIAANSVSLTYLPLSQKQTVSMKQL